MIAGGWDDPLALLLLGAAILVVGLGLRWVARTARARWARGPRRK